MTTQIEGQAGKTEGRNGAVRSSVLAPPELAQYHAVLQRLKALHSPNREGVGVAVGVTSGGKDEDAMTVALNLALSGATANQQTLLWDANIAAHALSRRLGAKRRPGWREILAGTAELPDCVVSTTAEGLSLLPAHAATHEEVVACGSEETAELLDLARDRFAIVVVDLPSTADLGICCNLVRQLDGVVLVIDAERANARDTALALRRLEQVQAKMLGAILNRQREYVPRWLRRRV